MCLNYSEFCISHFKQVNVDGSWKEMVSDYPKLGQQNIFAFRFPKFDQYVLYDPTVELSSSVQPTNSTSTTMHSSYTSAISTNAPSTTMHSSYAPTNHTTANPSDSATNLQVGALPIMLVIFGVLKLLLWNLPDWNSAWVDCYSYVPLFICFWYNLNHFVYVLSKSLLFKTFKWV